MKDVTSIHHHVCSLGASALDWPPDIFGFTAYFAKVTGVYTKYVTNPSWLKGVGEEAVRDGPKWIHAVNAKSQATPKSVRDAWAVICSGTGKTINQLKRDRRFVRALLFLLSAADEACAGVGIAESNKISYFEFVAELQLANSGTLCTKLPDDTIRVLPKMHTPRPGLNIRSLSHHLALCSASEVKAGWTKLPLVKNRPQKSAFNMLLVPWPLVVDPSAFSVADPKPREGDTFGYVDYRAEPLPGSPSVLRWLSNKLQQSINLGQHVDLVVFPECALSESQWRSVSKLCTKRGIAVVAGVQTRVPTKTRTTNSVRYMFPLVYDEMVQYKHHRWLIDSEQVKTYSLGGTLATDILWWENIQIRPRTIQFLSFDWRLSLCTLICEDLARQDPVSEIVRAVGPNLVIALLMDGPQLNGRWASRYATVLADDPGSSVLTLSSLGMVTRSKPPGLKKNRTIASWKDARGSFIPIELESNEDAILLNIQFECKEEWTVDGRSDNFTASFPVICGLHPLNEISL